MQSIFIYLQIICKYMNINNKSLILYLLSLIHNHEVPSSSLGPATEGVRLQNLTPIFMPYKMVKYLIISN